jgi:hypothetical protein
MAIQSVSSIEHPDGEVVHVFGEPIDVEPLIDREDVEDILIGGYVVESVADAQHDGMPALRFALSADNREVGRLVLRTGIATEFTFEFDVVFVAKEYADRFVDVVQNPPTKPKVVQSAQDFSYVGELHEEIAITAAKHGVSIVILEEVGPTGHPEVLVSGLYENVRACLMSDDYGWSYSEDVVETMVETVTA